MRTTRVAKSAVAPKKRGRPRKTPTVAQVIAAVAPKKRGRPRKTPTVAQVIAAIAPKRRGRPPTKIPVFGPSNRRGRPAKYTPDANTLAYLARIEAGGIKPPRRIKGKKYYKQAKKIAPLVKW